MDKYGVKLSQIKCQHDIQIFMWWLSDNPEVTNIQGFDVLRSNGRALALKGANVMIGVETLWGWRSTLNDWIRTQQKRQGPEMTLIVNGEAFYYAQSKKSEMIADLRSFRAAGNQVSAIDIYGYIMPSSELN